MICPTCHTDAEPAAQAQAVTVCSKCGETVINDRKAVYADVHHLAPAEFLTLRKAKTRVIQSIARP